MGAIPGFSEVIPFGINDRGQVVGGVPGGHAYLLTGSQVSTTIAVSASPNPSRFGQSVSFTATLTPASGTLDDGGAVQFAVDGTSHGAPVPLNDGSATIRYPAALTVGTHTITANYSGDINFSGISGTTDAIVIGPPVSRSKSVVTVSSSQSS